MSQEPQNNDNNNCSKMKHCPFAMAGKFIFLILIIYIIYQQNALQNSLVTEEKLANQLAIQSENLQKTINISLEKSQPEKTVLDVYQENYRVLESQNNQLEEDYKKKVNLLKSKQAKKKEFAIKILKTHREILARLKLKMLEFSNAKAPENPENSIENKGKEVLAKFVKITKISDVKTSKEFLLKKEVQKIPNYLIYENYQKIAEILSKSAEILSDEKYKKLATQALNF